MYLAYLWWEKYLSALLGLALIMEIINKNKGLVTDRDLELPGSEIINVKNLSLLTSIVYEINNENKRLTRGVISTFSWGGGKFYFYFSMPPDYLKIGKTSTLYLVIWRYS